MHPVFVSVIVPSYNSMETISACLASLRRQDLASPWEIIVVDSSSDATPDIVTRDFPEVQLIHFQSQTFPGPARNAGISVAAGEILAFLDSDCVAPRFWLSEMVTAHHTDCAAVGGPVAAAQPSSIVEWASYLMEFSEWLPGRSASWTMRNIPTCNISYKRSVFDEYGLFPNVYPNEDFVFNWTITKAGKRLLFHPGLVVQHKQRDGLADYLRHQHFRGRGGVFIRDLTDMSGQFIRKHPILAPLTFPPRRMGAITYNYLRSRPFGLPVFLSTLPLLCAGVAAWISGFVVEATRTPVTGKGRKQ